MSPSISPEAQIYRPAAAGAALDMSIDLGIISDIDRQPRPYLAPDLGADEYWPPGVLQHVYLPLIFRNAP